jgi:hypothetical protein
LFASSVPKAVMTARAVLGVAKEQAKDGSSEAVKATACERRGETYDIRGRDS